VKCKPAVGAAAEPGVRAYTVWYRSRSVSGREVSEEIDDYQNKHSP